MKQISFTFKMVLTVGLLMLLGSSLVNAQTEVSSLAESSNAVMIVAQPVSQTAAYGANVIFTVRAIGTNLLYQWQKDGVDLADYDNKAGAQTSSLTLIGVAQSDAGTYSVRLQQSDAVVTSAAAVLKVLSKVVFQDDFETGNLAAWTAFSEIPGIRSKFLRKDKFSDLAPLSRGGLAPDSERLAPSQIQNHTPDGFHSAQVSSSRDKMFHNLGIELAGRARLGFWVYDDDTQLRWFGELRGATPDRGTGPTECPAG